VSLAGRGAWSGDGDRRCPDATGVGGRQGQSHRTASRQQRCCWPLGGGGGVGDGDQRCAGATGVAGGDVASRDGVGGGDGLFAGASVAM
jgi:hypothetical protein